MFGLSQAYLPSPYAISNFVGFQGDNDMADFTGDGNPDLVTFDESLCPSGR